MEIRSLNTHDAVVAALGGKEPFAALISDRNNRRTANHVANYLRDHYFPTDTYAVVIDALEKICCSAPLSLWKKMVKPKGDALKRKAS